MNSRSKPIDFLIIGVQKGGTTTLDAHLREHPALCMAQEKELHFFDIDEHHAAGPDWYHARFAAAAHQLRGEATPIYIYWRDALPRIQQYNPAAKLIAILRNPIERAFSGWRMETTRGADSWPFWDAITRERERYSDQHRVFSYVGRGFYAAQLRRLWSYFPEKQTLILRTDDLDADPQRVVDAICDFLDVPPIRCTARREHVGAAGTMAPRERDYLRATFAPDIIELEKLLGWNCASWR